MPSYPKTYYHPKGNLMEASCGDLTHHFLSGIRFAIRFCEPGVIGGACGHGTCAGDGTRCICNEGYVHDFAFEYYPNCFAPWYVYSLTHAVVIALSLVTVGYGVLVYNRSASGSPARRVALGTILSASLYLVTMTAHECEAHMGMYTDLAHGLAVPIFLSEVVLPAMDVFLAPAFQFLSSRTYIRLKQTLTGGVVFFSLVLNIISVQAQRRLRLQGDLEGYNNMRAASHACMALFALGIALIFFSSARKVISTVEATTRSKHIQEPDPGLTTGDTVIESDEGPTIKQPVTLSSVGKRHLERIQKARRIVLPILTSIILSDVILISLHFLNGVFAYQYVFYLSVVAGSPMAALALLRLVDKQTARQTLGPTGSSTVVPLDSGTGHDTKMDITPVADEDVSGGLRRRRVKQ